MQIRTLLSTTIGFSLFFKAEQPKGSGLPAVDFCATPLDTRRARGVDIYPDRDSALADKPTIPLPATVFAREVTVWDFLQAYCVGTPIRVPTISLELVKTLVEDVGIDQFGDFHLPESQKASYVTITPAWSQTQIDQNRKLLKYCAGALLLGETVEQPERETELVLT